LTQENSCVGIEIVPPNKARVLKTDVSFSEHPRIICVLAAGALVTLFFCRIDVSRDSQSDMQIAFRVNVSGAERRAARATEGSLDWRIGFCRKSVRDSAGLISPVAQNEAYKRLRAVCPAALKSASALCAGCHGNQDPVMIDLPTYSKVCMASDNNR